MRDLIGAEAAAHAGTIRVRAALRVRGDLRAVERAINDQLPPAFEEIVEAGRPVRAIETVLLLDGHPRHPTTLGRHRVTCSGELLFLYQQLLAGRLPLLARDDRGCIHGELSSLSPVFVQRYESGMLGSAAQRPVWSSKDASPHATASCCSTANRLSDVDADVVREDDEHARRFRWFPKRSRP